MVTIRQMEIPDLDQVLPIEEANFSTPWTANGFFTFLIREDALFLIAEEKEPLSPEKLKEALNRDCDGLMEDRKSVV